jgi:hypothetical protein
MSVSDVFASEFTIETPDGTKSHGKMDTANGEFVIVDGKCFAVCKDMEFGGWSDSYYVIDVDKANVDRMKYTDRLVNVFGELSKPEDIVCFGCNRFNSCIHAKALIKYFKRKLELENQK